MTLPHTVYFFFGSLDFVRDYVHEHAPEMKPVISAYDSFSIDDARALRMKLGEFAEKDTIFVVRIEKMSTNDSQGVLLKICEELAHAHIAFSFPSRLAVFDTLLSRGVVVHEEAPVFHFDKKIADSFYKGTFGERMKIFEKLTKEYSDTEPKALVNQLIEDLVLAQDKKHAHQNGPIFIDALRLLQYQKSSPKQIFEYIALMVKK